MNNKQLANYVNDFLKSSTYQDKTFNGLQVEGKTEVKKIVLSVTANQETIDYAIKVGADAIMSHHGYFWYKEPVVGYFKNRLKSLLTNDINLFAWHLPLDFNLELGNNTCIAQALGADSYEYPVPGSMILVANFAQGITGQELAKKLTNYVQCDIIHLDKNCQQTLYKVGICSGGGQGFHDKAAELGCDGYITGEISEWNQHTTAELGVQYFAIGHHASERGGIQALGKHLKEKFPELEFEFFDYENRG